jgi:hypothetical protein
MRASVDLVHLTHKRRFVFDTVLYDTHAVYPQIVELKLARDPNGVLYRLRQVAHGSANCIDVTLSGFEFLIASPTVAQNGIRH